MRGITESLSPTSHGKDNRQEVDTTSSASLVIEKGQSYGNTEYIARKIQEVTGGYLYPILTRDNYTSDFQELIQVNHREMNNNYLPPLRSERLDISDYDTVFLGYPIWATTLPQAVLSFISQYDFSGKTIIPFCTHDGYGEGRSYNAIRSASQAIVLEGLAIEGKAVSTSLESVESWLSSLGLVSKEKALTITISDYVLEGVLHDTPLSHEIEAQLPITINMSRFGEREYYGGVSFYPENTQGGKRFFADGDITYCEAHHNMAIFFSQSSDPELSVEVIPIGRITSSLKVFEKLGARESVTIALK